MQFLLPPSETKVVGGTGVLALDNLHYSAALTPTRTQLLGAVETVCQDIAAAAQLFKLGPRAAAELTNNTVLTSSAVLPAVQRYTGVLYDALAVSTLTPAALSWLGEHVRIQSALFGLLGALDEIPNYRLSASTRIPAVGPLKKLWAAPHEGLLAAEFGADTPVLDMRSKDYVALAPSLSPNMRFLEVVQEGENGKRRALNHFNKAAKGELIRALAAESAELSSFAELIEWGKTSGFTLEYGETADTMLLVVA